VLPVSVSSAFFAEGHPVAASVVCLVFLSLLFLEDRKLNEIFELVLGRAKIWGKIRSENIHNLISTQIIQG
jgi:hypothetical protein